MADQVIEIIARTLAIPPGNVVDTLEYQDIPEWDSMGHLYLMLALEEQLGAPIEDELVPQLTTVRAIREFLAGRLA